MSSFSRRSGRALARGSVLQMRLHTSAALLGLVAACSWFKTSPTPADPNLVDKADTFCRLLFEAPKRQLEARCTPEDKGRPQYDRLVALASRPVEACVAALEPSVRAGRVKLHKPAAEACARAIESATWKSTLRTRDLGAYPECEGLSTGVQAEGGACRTSLDCRAGLWCADAKFESDGACRRQGSAAESCDAPLLFLFDEMRASCSSGYACDFGPFRPAYALGYPPVLSLGSSTRLAKRRSSAEKTGPRGGPDPLGFGTLGVKGSGPDAGGGRGEGGGLGSIGGFASSGQGRLGRAQSSAAPRVRAGAATVNGRLPPEVIHRVVRRRFARFRLCYEDGLRKEPKLEGQVSVRFVIGRDGSVSNPKGSGDLEDKSVVACLIQAFAGLSFPAPEAGIVTVVYPLVFLAGAVPAATTADAGADSDASEPAVPSASAPARAVVQKGADSPLVCLALLTRGKACAASHQCAAGSVCRAGTCEAPGNPGQVCASDLECAADHYCGASADVSGARGLCKALKATGAPCADSGECRGACGSDGTCIALCGAG